MKILPTMLRSAGLCLALTLGLSIRPVHAQTVPALVNYQGRLANPDGSPLATGDYQLTFRVYDSATNSGGLVWGPQVFDGVNAQGHGGRIPVVQGYFNVMLGPVDTNGVPLANAFTSSNRFVEIAISNRPPILPRQQILTTPFAFNSAKLSGADWSAVFGTNDPVNGKIPSTKLATNGTIIAQQIGVGPAIPSYLLDVSSSANNLFRVIGNGTSYGGSLLAQIYSERNVSGANGLLSVGSAVFPNTLFVGDNGNVGIGTAGPYFPLHLIKAGTSSGYLAGFLQPALADGNSATMWFGRADAQYQSGSLSYLYNASTPSSSRFSMGLFGNSAVLNVLGNGNVGIGTTSPQAKLDVNGDLRVGGNTDVSGLPYTAPLRISRTDDSSRYIYMGYDSGNFGFIQPIQQGVAYKNLVLNPSGGNVGIGTISPQNKLDVAGNIGVNDTINFPATGRLIAAGDITIQATTTLYLNPFAGSGIIQVGGVGGSGNMYVTGTLGLGRTPTANKLEVEGNASKTTASSWLANSDARIKKDIQTLEHALETLNQVRLVSFEYTDAYRRQHPSAADHRYLNVVAQEFQKAFPDYVQSSGERLPDGSEILQVDTYPLTIYSAAAIQELNHNLKEKEAEIEALKAKAAKIDLLEQRLAELERQAKLHTERN